MENQQNILEKKQTTHMRELIKAQIIYLRLSLKTYVAMSVEQMRGYEAAIADLENLLTNEK